MLSIVFCTQYPVGPHRAVLPFVCVWVCVEGGGVSEPDILIHCLDFLIDQEEAECGDANWIG